MKINPIMYQICQSRLIILPNKKKSVNILPKTWTVLPKWRNVAKSGHTVWVEQFPLVTGQIKKKKAPEPPPVGPSERRANSLVLSPADPPSLVIPRIVGPMEQWGMHLVAR